MCVMTASPISQTTGTTVQPVEVESVGHTPPSSREGVAAVLSRRDFEIAMMLAVSLSATLGASRPEAVTSTSA